MVSKIHLDLLKSSEHTSASAVRAGFLVPAVCCLVALSAVAFWLSQLGHTVVLESQVKSTETDIALAQRAYKLSCANQSKANLLKQEVTQLMRCKRAHSNWGQALSQIALSVSPEIQLTTIELLPPQPYNLLIPRSRTKAKLWGQATTTEPMKLTLTGRTTQATPVNQLISFLTGTTCESFVKDATIPRGAFRLDDYSKQQNMMRFTIECNLVERSYECIPN